MCLIEFEATLLLKLFYARFLFNFLLNLLSWLSLNEAFEPFLSIIVSLFAFSWNNLSSLSSNISSSWIRVFLLDYGYGLKFRVLPE